MSPLTEILGVHPVEAYHVSRVLRRRFVEAPGGGIRLRPNHEKEGSSFRVHDRAKTVIHRDAVALKAARAHIEEVMSGELPIMPTPVIPEQEKPTIIWASVDRKGFSVLRKGERIPVGFRPVPGKASQPSQFL